MKTSGPNAWVWTASRRTLLKGWQADVFELTKAMLKKQMEAQQPQPEPQKPLQRQQRTNGIER